MWGRLLYVSAIATIIKYKRQVAMKNYFSVLEARNSKGFVSEASLLGSKIPPSLWVLM